MNCLNQLMNSPPHPHRSDRPDRSIGCSKSLWCLKTWRIWWGNRQQRRTCCFSLTRMHLRLLPPRPPLLCSSSLLGGLVERLDSRWQGPTPPPVMNGGWCHLGLDRRPCMYTKEASASGVKRRACSRFLSPHDISLMVEAGFMCQMIFT